MKPFVQPISPQTMRLAARGMQREADKIPMTVRLAQESGFLRQIERTIHSLSRL